ncbi:cytoplasmic copper homeostasis protein cutC [Klebsiella pneumoniae subsp. rhinoscleromatis]|nr:cytoplasmic copper homeostasis protein cutC [Klebsiella pneumoniae subsp. rhinoscleromatis]
MARSISADEKNNGRGGPLAVTFHRAFDLCADPRQAWKTLGELGGQTYPDFRSAILGGEGISLITELIAAGDTPIIMAGAGVRAANLPLFLQAGVKEVHSSAGHWLPSEMRFRHPGVSMSADPDADEYRRYAVNGAAVAEMKRIISAWRS